jgi:hypothetical protein
MKGPRWVHPSKNAYTAGHVAIASTSFERKASLVLLLTCRQTRLSTLNYRVPNFSHHLSLYFLSSWCMQTCNLQASLKYNQLDLVFMIEGAEVRSTSIDWRPHLIRSY